MIDQDEIEMLRGYADDKRQNYPMTMEVLDNVCSEVEQLTKSDKAMRGILRDFIAIEGAVASNELIHRAREALNELHKDKAATG